MFWLVLLFGAMAMFFIKFGAMAVAVSLLSTGLTVALVVSAVLLLVLVWRTFRRSGRG